MSASGQRVAVLVELLCFFTCLTGCIFLQIYNIQPKPYMDEIFHVPQAQNYCQGHFTHWDNKITTPPGLYLMSVAIIKPMIWMVGSNPTVACSVLALRSLNVLFAVGNFLILVLVVQKVHRHDNEATPGRVLATAFTLSTLPVLYFFTFLYYTDAGSAFFVLLMYCAHIHDYRKVSAVIGAFSLMFRQTNVVWVMFAAGVDVTKVVVETYRIDKKRDSSDTQSLGYLTLLVTEVVGQPLTLGTLLRRAIRRTWPQIVVGVVFLAFIRINGGVVLGDRSAHQVCFHAPMLFYWISFCAGLSFVHVVTTSHSLDFVRAVRKRPGAFLTACVLCAALVWQFTYRHPYLLSDNRHYTFYLNTKVFQRHPSVPYLLIPTYLYALYGLQACLRSAGTTAPWQAVFYLCVALSIVPQRLLEFRYFIVPYLLWAIHKPVAAYWRVACELALYSAINAATIYLFVKKPFLWDNSQEIQRFIW